MTTRQYLFLQELIRPGRDDDVAALAALVHQNARRGGRDWAEDVKDLRVSAPHATVGQLAATVRGTLTAPPQVRLADGAWCPLDDTLLRLELTGLVCPACGAGWDHTGRHGWWITDAELLATLDPSPGDDHRTQECPEWTVDADGGSERLRRLDRQAALAVGFVSAGLLGALVGWASRPSGQTLSDGPMWTVAGAVAAALVVYAAVAEFVGCLRSWWPHRHNRPLDPGQIRHGDRVRAEGEVPDGR